jgi:hypothetical protein
MSRAPLFQSQLPHYEAKAVTLPKFALPEVDEIEAKEVAERFAEQRIIKDGRDAWQEVSRAGSFENWKKIGFALLVGKTHALRVTRANAAWGSAYSREFGIWLKGHQFDRMPGPVRSVAITLAENATEITEWRNGLPEKQRRRLINPQSVVKRWRSATQADADRERDSALLNRQPGDEGRPPANKPTKLVSLSPGGTDRQAAQLAQRSEAEAEAWAAWLSFISKVEVLPQNQQRQLWREVQTAATAAIDLPTQCPHNGSGQSLENQISP